jgi:hypothetical protein
MAIKVSKVKQHSTVPTGTMTTAESDGLPSLAWPLEHWLQFQADLFRAAQPALLGWVDRRCEGSEAALQAFAGLATCQDLGQAMSIQSEWLSASMKRLESDLQAAAEQALAVGQCTTGATQRAAQTTRDEARLGASWIVRNLDATQSAANRSDVTEIAPPAAAEALWQSR